MLKYLVLETFGAPHRALVEMRIGLMRPRIDTMLLPFLTADEIGMRLPAETGEAVRDMRDGIAAFGEMQRQQRMYPVRRQKLFAVLRFENFEDGVVERPECEGFGIGVGRAF